jgi:hypothetical protein
VKELAVLQELGKLIVKNDIRFWKECGEALSYSDLIRNVARVVGTSATPAIQCVPVGAHPTHIIGRSWDRNLLCSERSDQRVVNIDEYYELSIHV